VERDRAEMACVAWTEVKEIYTFKRDLFGYDSVSLLFELRDPDRELEIWEEMSGFSDVMAEIPRRFPNVAKNWFEKVCFPPFATNWTKLHGPSDPPPSR
jgi:hypothetical protein